MLKIQDTIVSLDLIEQFFCCDLSQCLGQCCIEGDAGAPVSDREDAEIKKHLTEILPLLTPAGRTAIAEDSTSYIDVEGDRVTQIVNGRDCAFCTYAPNGICLCALEKASREGLLPPLKPISCHLYPARIKEYDGFTAINFHKWKICKSAIKTGREKNIRAYEFLREPLIRRFGKEWYDELDFTAKQYLAQNNK